MACSYIRTKRHQPVNDLSSWQYSLPESNAYTLHGKIPYSDKKNYLYQQKKNIHSLLNANQSLRVIPHRVNSIGNLKDVWLDGYRAFEIDVRFDKDTTGHFEVGNNHGDMSKISFEQFIASIYQSDIKKIRIRF